MSNWCRPAVELFASVTTTRNTSPAPVGVPVEMLNTAVVPSLETWPPPIERFWVTSVIWKLAPVNVPAGAVSVTVPGNISWPVELVVNWTV